MDYKAPNDFENEYEYEAYAITLLVGELMNLNKQERGQVWDFITDYMDELGGLDAQDFETLGYQIKVLLGIKEASKGPSIFTH